MHPMLNIAVKAARRAGTIINRASVDVETLRVGRKEANDFVTEVDQAAEAAIIEILHQAYPDHAILGEESGLLLGRGAEGVTDFDFATAENVWILDPLDGTTNFIHGLPQYAVSIALMQRGQVTQAVVYDPAKNELFTASKGRGAFLNERRIRVSKRVQLQESLIGTGFPFRNIETIDSYLGMFKAISQKAAGLRRPGAAALDLAYVACGRYDGFFELGLSPWDAAAGSLLVQEAGGLVADFNGEGEWLFGENIIAGTPKVFAQMLQTLTGFARPETNRTQEMLAKMRRGEGVTLMAQEPTSEEGDGTWTDPTVRAVRPSRTREVEAELAADAAQAPSGAQATDSDQADEAEHSAAADAQDPWGGDADEAGDEVQAAGHTDEQANAEDGDYAEGNEAALHASADGEQASDHDGGDEDADEDGDGQPYFGADADMFDAGATAAADGEQTDKVGEQDGEHEPGDVNGNSEGYVPQRRFDNDRGPRGDRQGGGFRGGERSGGYGDRGGFRGGDRSGGFGDRGGFRGGERTGGFGDRAGGGGFRGGERTGGFGDRAGGGGFRGGERTGGFGDRAGGGGFRGGERTGGFGDRAGGGGFRGGERTGGFGDRTGGGGFRGGERTGGFGDRTGGGGFRGGERTGGFGDRTGGGGGFRGGERTGGFGDRAGGDRAGGGFRGGERTGGFGDRTGGDRAGGGFRGGERTGGFGDRSGGGGFRGGEQRSGGFGDRSGGGGFRGGDRGGFGDRTGGGGSFGGDRGPRRFGDGAGRSDSRGGEGRSFSGPRGGDRGGFGGGSGGGRGGFGGGSGGGGRGGFGGGNR